MGKSLVLATVVVGAALSTVALALRGIAGPAPSRSDQKSTARTASKGRGDKSNEKLSQPKLIEHSFPLEGDGERAKSVRLLQQLTVDLLAIDNIYKEAHWNLSGPLYLQLHEYYDQQAAFYHKQADDFAERILHLGYSVDGRYATIARNNHRGIPGGLSDGQ